MNLKSIFFLKNAILFCTFLSSFGNAQQMWNTGLTQKEISIEYLKPTFSETIFGPSLTGYTINVLGRISISERKTIIISLPYFQGKQQYNSYYTSYNYSANTLGNLYIGLETKKENAPFRTNIGIFLPTISEDKLFAGLLGIYSNPDNYEAAIPNAVILSFRGNYHSNEQQGLGAITRGGISVMIRTKTSGISSNDSFEAFFNYAFQPTFSFESFNAIVGFTGKMILTENGDIADRVLHQFGAAASYKFDFVRPEIFIRVPINENLSNRIENTYGFSLSVEL